VLDQSTHKAREIIPRFSLSGRSSSDASNKSELHRDYASSHDRHARRLQNNLPLSISPANYHSWPTFSDPISAAISARVIRARRRRRAPLTFGFCAITQIAELFVGPSTESTAGSDDLTSLLRITPRSSSLLSKSLRSLPAAILKAHRYVFPAGTQPSFARRCSSSLSRVVRDTLSATANSQHPIVTPERAQKTARGGERRGLAGEFAPRSHAPIKLLSGVLLSPVRRVKRSFKSANIPGDSPRNERDWTLGHSCVRSSGVRDERLLRSRLYNSRAIFLVALTTLASSRESMASLYMYA